MDMSFSRKALLAEDNPDILEMWIHGLHNDGFDLRGQEINQIIRDAAMGLSVLALGHHELHITAFAPTVGRAVQEHAYDVCFMDGVLLGGTTYKTVVELLRAPISPKIYLISSALGAQMKILGETYGLDTESLQGQGRLYGGFKAYPFNRRKVLAPLFGLTVPERAALAKAEPRQGPAHG
jgi:hypothetical protein